MKETGIEILESVSPSGKNGRDEIAALYRNALDKTDLTPADYLSIRDLVRISGYDDVFVHALLLCMFMSLNEGSIRLKLDKKSLAGRLSRISDSYGPLAGEIIAEIGSYPELVFCAGPGADVKLNENETYRPLIFDEKNDGMLYFQKYYVYAKKVNRNLKQLLERECSHGIDGTKIKSVLYDVLVKKPLSFHGSPVVLNSAQVLALVLPVVKNFVIISGGPGTGKTSIVVNLLRIFLRCGIDPEKIRVAAPTGRAAQRLTDSLHQGISSLKGPDPEDSLLERVTISTIHRLLRYSPSRNAFLYNERNRVPADLVILDEVSMVDLVLLGKFLDSLGPGTGIVLLGDRNQLPSVEAGTILADVMPRENMITYSEEILSLLKDISKEAAAEFNDRKETNGNPLKDRVVMLTESYRSVKEISDMAERINNQDESVAEIMPSIIPGEKFPGSGIARIVPRGQGKAQYREFLSILEQWAHENYFLSAPGFTDYREAVKEISRSCIDDLYDSGFLERMDALFARLNGAKILCPVRAGFFGTEGINLFLSGLFSASSERSGGVFPGMPLIITRNDYGRGLFNGDLGLVLMDSGNNFYSYFARPGGYVRYPVRMLPSFETAFAVTVHKSQGSEYDRVLLVLEQGSERLLSREILYTAVTRARSSVLIYGKTELLVKAVKNRIERESGIDLIGG